MRIVRRYLFRTILSTILLVLCVLLSLAYFIEFVTQLDEIGTGNYGIIQALIYTLFQLPNYGYQMFPMAVLLGALLGLGGLANHGELVVLRASGVSVKRLARAVMWTGAALTLFMLLLGEYVAPPMDSYARQYRAEAKHGEGAMTSGRSAWIRDGDTFVNISRLAAGSRLGGVYLYRLTPDGDLAAIGHADSANIDEQSQWVLSNFSESQFTDQGVRVSAERSRTEAYNLSTELIGLTVVKPDSLNSSELFKYVQYLEGNDLDASRYEVALWSRLAAAFAVTPMCVLALPFVFGRMRSSGAGAKMVAGIVIGLAYYLGSRGLADGGQVYNIDPLIVGWFPTVALAAVTMFSISRTR